MRIALIYNAEAGVGVYDESELTRLFAAAGYNVTSYSKKQRQIEEALERGSDVIVAAGGDGTVARVAIALDENKATVPFFILPLGTSNNIARSVGLDAPVPLLVKTLKSAREVPFDIGRATLDGCNAAFVESAGLGFIGTMLHRESSLATRIEKFLRNIRPGASEAEMVTRGVARLVRRERVRRFEIVADGQNLSGEYLTVEALNIRCVGPRVVLAPHADHGDGLLDLLMVPENGREQLSAYVLSMSRKGRTQLPQQWFRRVRHIEISWRDDNGHLDDDPWPTPDDDINPNGRATLQVGGSVNVLLPAL